MVDIVTKENRWLYDDLLTDMHRMRYQVAVEELGWNIPGIRPGFDLDEFDTDETVYLLEIDELHTQVLGCARLNPTTGPHLLRDVFSGSCDLQAVPSSPSIWECSRFLIDRRRCRTKERNTLARQRLGIALSEYCIAHGISHITWLTYEMFYNNILGVYTTEPLGTPRYHKKDKATYIPALSKVDRAGLERQRAKLIEPQTHITFYYGPLTLPDEPVSASRAA